MQDSGEGIAARHIPRLTERFYRVDESRSRSSAGTGLGLAIVKHALDAHGANLRVESSVGSGVTFTCDFPESLIAEQGQVARCSAVGEESSEEVGRAQPPERS